MSDYEIPAIGLSEAAAKNPGKYDRMRTQYFQPHRPGLYNRLLLPGVLHTHSMENDQTARKRMEWMMPETNANYSPKAKSPRIKGVDTHYVLML